MGRVIAVSSIKGGVGKTTATVNLAAVLFRMGKRVLVVDGNLSVPNLGIHFGLIDVDSCVHDVLGNIKCLWDAVYEYSCGFDVMPGRVRGKFLKRWRFSGLVDEVRDEYDFILIDTSPAVDELDRVLEVCDLVVFVATADYATISSTIQLIERIRGKVEIGGIILNMVKGRRWELSAREVADACEVSVLGSVPYFVGVQKAMSNFRPFGLRGRWNRAYRAYRVLAEGLVR